MATNRITVADVMNPDIASISEDLKQIDDSLRLGLTEVDGVNLVKLRKRVKTARKRAIYASMKDAHWQRARDKGASDEDRLRSCAWLVERGEGEAEGLAEAIKADARWEIKRVKQQNMLMRTGSVVNKYADNDNAADNADDNDNASEDDDNDDFNVEDD